MRRNVTYHRNMSEVINIKELNERIERESVFIDTLQSGNGQGDRRAEAFGRHAADRAAVERAYFARGRSGTGQDAGHHDAGSGRRRPFQPDSVHARPAAGRPARYADIHVRRPRSSSVRKGPIFANFILADEINRSPGESAERRCSRRCRSGRSLMGDTTYRLPEPFLVLATQNPLEQEGTYPLPEAQVDRFMLKATYLLPQEAGGARHRAHEPRRRRACPKRATGSSRPRTS